MASPSSSQVHIFCTVVDNYGDAGVCLRLARHSARKGSQTTLVIDKPDLIDRMMPSWRNEPLLSVQANAPHPQDCLKDPSQSGRPTGPGEPFELTVIEAFQCDAPLDYRIALEALHAAGTTVHRMALDYLATEPWAASHQGLATPDLEAKRALAGKGITADTNGPAATRKWFAPSFDGRGFPLIHDDFIDATPDQRQQMRSRLGASQADDFLVMAFGYPDAPWEELKQVFQIYGLPPGFKQTVLWQPKGLELTQDEFDIALQACDLNFVRGEDSFVRAHWAAASRWQVPFVWQPYRQAGQAHADKLNGWLTTVGELESRYQVFSLEFNGLGTGVGLSKSWPSVLSAWDPIRAQLNQFGATCQRRGS